MPIKRRELLRGLGGLAAYAWLPVTGGCPDQRVDSETNPTREGPEFLHGVASGDPLPDGVILWTRVSPPGSEPLAVQWELAEDPEFQRIVGDGEEETDGARDYTVKLDVRGLEPGKTYYYRFQCGEAQSAVGRTRTAPQGAVERLRFAVASCSSYAHGYFHAYRAISQRTDLDAVIHLGDYIYEYADGEYGELRDYDPPHETLTLEDYRRRHAHYRLDPELRAVHEQLPMIVIWDDHEIANNTWSGGAENHNPSRGEGDFRARKTAAVRAYFEWMPIRESSDRRTFRSLAYGDLVDLILLDTRNWGRAQQALEPRAPELQDPARSLLGADQEAWLADAMQESSARWRLIAQQVMIGPFAFYMNLDDWTGYPAARDRFLALLEQHGSKDCVVLTGDVHSSWAMNIVRDATKYDPETGRGALAPELVVPGISSVGLDRSTAEALQPGLLEAPHVKYVDLWQRGYMVLDIDAERVRASWYLYADVSDPKGADERLAQVCVVYPGEHRVQLET